MRDRKPLKLQLTAPEGVQKFRLKRVMVAPPPPPPAPPARPGSDG
jgi:hypothetical protein